MLKKARLLPAMLLPTIVVGCVLLHPTDPYVPVMARRSRRVGTITSRSSSRKALRSPLTLEGCIQIALRDNPAIGQRGWDVAVAAAERDIAVGQAWPTISGVGSYKHFLDDQRLVPPRSGNEPGVFGDDIFAGDLVLKMPLFTGGRITSEIKAAELLQEAAAHRLGRTREELVFNVSSVFYNILGQRHVIESVEFSKRALEEHRKRINDLIGVQKAARVDLLRTEVRLSDVNQRLVAERNALAVLHRVLANLLGVEASKSALEIQGELELPQQQVDLAGSLREAYIERSDYLALRRELEAQGKRVDAARAGRWPTVSLEGSYGVRYAADPTTRPSGSDATEDVGFVGVVAEVPLFEGGRISARIRRERARLGSLQQQLRELELQIRLDVETAVLNIASSGERVAATEKAIEQGKESLRIEREKYELGRGSITDVLDAQSGLLDAQTSYYRALADYNTSVAELHRAVGEE